MSNTGGSGFDGMRSYWHQHEGPHAHVQGPGQHYHFYRRGQGGPFRARFFWFALGAGTTYMFTRSSARCDERRELQTLRARYDAERIAGNGDASMVAAPTASRWGQQWSSGWHREGHDAEAADRASVGGLGNDARGDQQQSGRDAASSSPEEGRAFQPGPDLEPEPVSELDGAGISKADLITHGTVQDQRVRGRLRLIARADSVFSFLAALRSAFFSIFHYVFLLVPSPIIRILEPYPYHYEHQRAVADPAPGEPDTGLAADEVD